MLLRKLPVFPEDTDRSLNLYIIYIALPALILIQIPGLEFSMHILIPVIIAWGTVALSAILVLLLSRLLGWNDKITGAMLLMVPLGNTSFIGIPMIDRFFGPAGIPHALIYDQFGSFMALSTYGTFILAVYGEGRKKVDISRMVTKILTFPPFLALSYALVFRSVQYPQWLNKLLEMAASSLVPVVLVAIGFAMRLLLPRGEIVPLACGLSIRLIVTPLLILLACHAAGMSGLVTRVSILETAMPPMVTAGAMASIAGLEPRLTASMVGTGILISFFTLPVIFRLNL